MIAGGQIRGYMLKHLQSQQDGVDVALAQALLRLESEGVIALSTVQDYTISNPSGIVRLLSGSREERAFTHIAQGVSA
ncbi:hypothetical protein DVS28_a0333 [Euzebya pacifica]|uniref:Uncharacterized protein n=1 Tax=Euzebya pacifica TaxID=1608957 RepID=A0A346XS43_9ACTN|nr:hypothetical protein DVS28_a0333 [Euzebya pacifica]